MKLRPTLIAMMALSVLSDAILIPFYPLFFAQRYSTTSALHAGAYVAAISLVVMMTLPLWARLAKRIDALHLLTGTQCAAGVLSIVSCIAPSLPVFWLVSLLMFMCKSSYLLMYPYLMRLEPADTRAGTIGTLSIAGHFSAIFGAVLGGWLMQAWDAGASMLAMAAADFIQAALCLHLIGAYRIARKPVPIAMPETGGEARSGVHCHGSSGRAARWPILRLAFLMFAFDLSAYLARPFFSTYWQQTGNSASEALAGLVFAIPGFIAIAALWINRRASMRGRRAFDHLVPNLLLGALGLLLHASDAVLWIVVGRCLFGWALFQVTVRLDVTLFRLSNPEAFATDHSIAYFFQNLGVLVASFAAGLIVDHHSLGAPFYYAAAGFAVTSVFIVLMRTTVDPDDTRGSRKPIASHRGFVFRRLRVPDDIGLLHGWFGEARAHFWGMQDKTVVQLEQFYRTLLDSGHACAYLGLRDDVPAFLVECYDPAHDEAGEHYTILQGDVGMHVFVAPAIHPVHGHTREVFAAVMTFLFETLGARRVVVEPDIHNEKIHVLNKAMGFVPAKVVTFRAKIASLALCTRQDFYLATQAGTEPGIRPGAQAGTQVGAQVGNHPGIH